MRPRTPPTPDGSKVPPELRDDDAEYWQTAEAFQAYMEARGWWSRHIAVRGSMFGTAPPFRRRRWAVESWARDVGIVQERWPAARRPDWHRLKVMGL